MSANGWRYRRWHDAHFWECTLIISQMGVSISNRDNVSVDGETPIRPDLPMIPPFGQATSTVLNSRHLSQTRTTHQAVDPSPTSQSLLLARDTVGAAALIGAAAFSCWFLITKLWALLIGGDVRGGGRVVRDRSMGGKSVFIPNQPLKRPEVLPNAKHSVSCAPTSISSYFEMTDLLCQSSKRALICREVWRGKDHGSKLGLQRNCENIEAKHVVAGVCGICCILVLNLSQRTSCNAPEM